MSRIYLICPSYGRPANVARMLASAESTARDPGSVTLCVGYDDDDAGEMIAPRARGQSVEVLRHRLPTTGIGAQAKALALLYPQSPKDIVFATPDDLIFETAGWDDKLREATASESGPWLYYVNDGINGVHRATIAFMTKRTSDIIGGLAEPWMNIHGDVWLWCLFHLFAPPRVTYVPDIVTRHIVDGRSRNYDDMRPEVFAAIRRYGPDLLWRQWHALVNATPALELHSASTNRFSAAKDGLRLDIGPNGAFVSVEWFDSSTGAWRE